MYIWYLKQNWIMIINNKIDSIKVTIKTIFIGRLLYYYKIFIKKCIVLLKSIGVYKGCI